MVLANGADNVAVYISLFSTSTVAQIAAYAGVFLCLSAAWCGLAYYLVRRGGLRARLERHTRWLLPAVLIGLGVYIVAKGFWA